MDDYYLVAPATFFITMLVCLVVGFAYGYSFSPKPERKKQNQYAEPRSLGH